MIFLPFLLRDKGGFYVPMGDALMALPIIDSTDMKLFLPKCFTGDLVASLTDLPVVREIGPSDSVNPITSTLFKDERHPLYMKNWGSPEHRERFGAVNATLYYAMALGIKLKDPAPRVKRPVQAVKGKVIIIPNGSVPHRSFLPAKVKGLESALQDKGYDVYLGDRTFESHSDFAKFIASAEYLISPCTGPMHLAAAMGVKTINIITGDSPWAYRPLHENVATLSSDCDKCWFTKSGKLCKDEIPYCQNMTTVESIISTLEDFDNKKGGMNILSNQELKAQINYH